MLSPILWWRKIDAAYRPDDLPNEICMFVVCGLPSPKASCFRSTRTRCRAGESPCTRQGRDIPGRLAGLALGGRRTPIFPVREFIGSTFSWSKLPERRKTAHAVHTPLKNRFRPPQDEFLADYHLMSKIIEKNSSFYLLSRVHECILRKAAETNGFEKDFR